MAVEIRDYRAADVADVTAIYAHAVLNDTATWDTDPPTASAMAAKARSVQEGGLPYLIADQAGEVMGFAYAAPFRQRAAYNYTVETSIYLAPEAKGQGMGRALMTELEERLAAKGIRQLMAIIGDTATHHSVAFHKAIGFTERGRMPELGWKFGRWWDLVLMQKSLGPGGSMPPDGA